jgi:death-on-curing protein
MGLFSFLSKTQVIDLHDTLIEEHGGSHGIRDENALDSAIRAPEFRHYYENADEAKCASTYAYHLTKNHAFVDGNKRTAAGAAEVFLDMNNKELKASNEQIKDLILGIADGSVSRETSDTWLAKWVMNE